MQQRPNETHLKECFTKYLNDNEINLSSQETIIFHTQKALFDANHPRHRSSLQMLHTIVARDRKDTEFKEKTSGDHTLAAIHKMQEIGLSSKTISKIIESLYDIRLNYHNSMAKIQELGKVTFEKAPIPEESSTKENTVTNRRNHQMSIWGNIQNKVGGDCNQLAIAYRDLFHHKKILSLLRKDLPKENLRIHIVKGQDRTYFTQADTFHTSCLLSIGKNKFTLDPSLGEMNIHPEWGYTYTNIILEKITPRNVDKIYKKKSNSVLVFQTNDLEITETTEGVLLKKDDKNKWIFMGMLNNSDYLFGVSYVQKEKWGRIYPCIALYKKDQGSIIGILGDDKEVWTDNKDISPALKEEIKQHLLALDAITDYS